MSHWNPMQIKSNFVQFFLLPPLEGGRFKNIPAENRKCEICEWNQVESESRFLLYCYKNMMIYMRFCLMTLVKRNLIYFWCSHEQKLEWLFRFNIFKIDHFTYKVRIIWMMNLFDEAWYCFSLSFLLFLMNYWALYELLMCFWSGYFVMFSFLLLQ